MIIGGDRFPVLVTPGRGCSLSGWLPEPMGPIGPGGPLPVTVPAISCIRCCIRRDSPTRLSRSNFALHDLYISNAVKCVPPENKPRPEEFTACLPYLEQELKSLPDLQVVLALGQNAFRSYLQLLKQQGIISRFADHPFGHGRIYRFGSGPRLVASYHTSRYNLQTGRINTEMFLDLLADIRSLLDGENG